MSPSAWKDFPSVSASWLMDFRWAESSTISTKARWPRPCVQGVQFRDAAQGAAADRIRGSNHAGDGDWRAVLPGAGPEGAWAMVLQPPRRRLRRLWNVGAAGRHDRLFALSRGQRLFPRRPPDDAQPARRKSRGHAGWAARGGHR